MSSVRVNASRGPLLLTTVGLGLIVSAIFVSLLLSLHRGLHDEIRETVIRRDANVLQPVARHQIVTAEERVGAGELRTEELLLAVLPSAQQDGMLAVAVFDQQGNLVRALPDSLLFAELPVADYLTMLRGETVSRFHAALPLDRYFRGAAAGTNAPVMEVIVPLESRRAGPIGFAQYYMDARNLSGELASIQQRLERQVRVTLLAGVGLLVLVLGVAYLGIARVQRIVAERNERLARTNFELTLAAKASALGQITSHLIHGLQGSVAELRTAVSPGNTDLATAARHADSMHSMISEVIGLLGDARVGAVFELRGHELATIIENRSAALAASKDLRLTVNSWLTSGVASHRGSLLCLIAANLIQNAANAAPTGCRINVELRETPTHLTLIVADEGPGIPEAVRERLFQPGVTGRLGGTGLGLAISRLITRQLNGELELVTTGPLGTVFRATVPKVD